MMRSSKAFQYRPKSPFYTFAQLLRHTYHAKFQVDVHLPVSLLIICLSPFQSYPTPVLIEYKVYRLRIFLYRYLLIVVQLISPFSFLI